MTRDTTHVSDAADGRPAAGSSAASAAVGPAGPAEVRPAEVRPAAVRPAAVTSAAVTSAEAIAAQAAGQAGGENFPVALRLLPARYRGHLAAVYGFARSADDMGDEAPAAQRLALLDELTADIGRLYRALGQEVTAAAPSGDAPRWEGPGGVVAGGKAASGDVPGRDGPRLAVVRALAPAVAECRIPAQPFLDLIEANRQDQIVSRYRTFEDLMAYCRLSANPVGRLVLHIFGAATPDREALSDQVCTALQLAEHWQDVAEDLRAGRIYLPREDMDSFGCGEADLAAPTAGPAVRSLMEFEAKRARAMLDAGAPIVGMLSGAARVAVAGYVAGGRAALAAITAAGHDVLAATRRPRKHRVAMELVRAYAAGR